MLNARLQSKLIGADDFRYPERYPEHFRSTRAQAEKSS